MDLDSFINIGMLREPYNWFVVALMLAFGAFALCLITQGGYSPI